MLIISLKKNKSIGISKTTWKLKGFKLLLTKKFLSFNKNKVGTFSVKNLLLFFRVKFSGKIILTVNLELDLTFKKKLFSSKKAQSKSNSLTKL